MMMCIDVSKILKYTPSKKNKKNKYTLENIQTELHVVFDSS